MNRITQILYDAKINMNTLITNDSAEFGIIRMLVSDTDKAAKILKEAGYMCHSDYVAAAEISDECGSLNGLLNVISDGNINLDYSYVTYNTLQPPAGGHPAGVRPDGGGGVPESPGRTKSWNGLTERKTWAWGSARSG
jgi:ACT domain-containing protein